MPCEKGWGTKSKGGKAVRSSRTGKPIRYLSEGDKSSLPKDLSIAWDRRRTNIKNILSLHDAVVFRLKLHRAKTAFTEFSLNTILTGTRKEVSQRIRKVRGLLVKNVDVPLDYGPWHYVSFPYVNKISENAYYVSWMIDAGGTVGHPLRLQRASLAVSAGKKILPEANFIITNKDSYTIMRLAKAELGGEATDYKKG